MNYRASSVIAELKNNKDIEFLTSIPKCPKESSISCGFHDDKSCHVGLNQNCIQELKICVEKKLNFVNFNYLISGDDKDGFIDEKNLSLRLIIQKNLIDKEKLKYV